MRNKFTTSLSVFLCLGLLSACASTSSVKGETSRLPAAGHGGDKLPSVFYKHSVGTEQIQTNYCWIVKVDRSEPDLQRYFMADTPPELKLTDEDIGRYSVLGEIHYYGFGGDGYPKFTDPAHKAVSYDEALNILQTDDDCTAW